MANMDLGKIRRSAAVTTHGPGAVIDFRTPEGAPVSVVAAGLEEWDGPGAPGGLASDYAIHEVRLMRTLNVRGFRLPPVSLEDADYVQSLVGVRFPKWLQCPGCGTLAYYRNWSSRPGSPAKYCGECTARSTDETAWAIPVRFVVSCPAGHLDDFPWHFWVQHVEDCNNRSGALKLETVGAGLAGLLVRCPECGKGRSMDGIFRPGALGGIRCRGHRPWLREGQEDCGGQPWVLQRGASNLYFPNHVSSLEIPPWGHDIEKKLGRYWSDITHLEGGPEKRKSYLEMIYPSLDVELSLDELSDRVEARMGNLSEPDSDNLRWGEYRQFTGQGAGDHVNLEDFEIRVERPSESIADYVESLVRVVRLREVRALTSFTRIKPLGSQLGNGEDGVQVQRARITKKESPLWYPAVEVRGEGIFLALDERRVLEWCLGTAVRARARRSGDVDAAVAALGQSCDRERLEEFSARLLLAHSLAHLLIRQLSLECGYSSASIRERLYVGVEPRPMCGILVYTATTDADGTLGGLQRQGEPQRFEQILVNALGDSEWCSSDPLCMQERLSLSDEHNLAACHSCLLVPETSCEQFNHYLDRGVVVGASESREEAFFGSLSD